MDFKVLFSQLVILYAKLTKQQKVIIAVAVVGIVAFLLFLVVYTAQKNQPNKYEVLFDSLSSSDAAKVVEQLEKDNIEYKLEANNVIKVPKNVVYKQRIAIASLGIPKDNGVGFELFDTQEFGATSFDQKIKHLRALEGELSRTINALSPIESTSVSLALPKESLFVSKQVAPTASVMIHLVDGRNLSSKQVRGIKNQVVYYMFFISSHPLANQIFRKLLPYMEKYKRDRMAEYVVWKARASGIKPLKDFF